MEITQFIDTIKQGENDKVEFKLNIQKEIAADICAFLNTDGGHILIGIDNDGNVIGIDDLNASKQKLADIINSINPHVEIKTSSLDLSFMEKQGKCILIIEIEKDSKLYSWKNRAHIRVGRNNRPLTINELIEKASESILIYFDEQPSKYPAEIISKKRFGDYLNKRYEKRGIAISGTMEENLRQLKIVKNRKATHGGILCFSQKPQNYFPYARVRLIKFENEGSTSYTDSKEFNGPLSEIMDGIEKYFLNSFKVIGEEIKGFERKEYLEYPIVALREAVANALAHRNYFDPTEILIIMYPNKIIIKNPGAFPPGVTVNSPFHKARNPMLSSHLYDLGYIDKWGSGIKKILSTCKEHPLVDVEFIINPYHTQVSFFKRIEKVEEKLDDISKKVLALLENKGELNSSTISQDLGKSKPTIVEKINLLIAYGLVLKKGSGPKVTYLRIKEPRDFPSKDL